MLLHPWDFPGKSTGVGCHYLLWYIGTKKPKMSHDQSCDIGFIAVAWNRTGDLSEACLCVPKCSCPREAFYTTSSRAIVLLYIRECFPWQVKDEIWKQEGSGLSTTSLPASEYQCEPLCEAGKGPSAAFFLLFTKCSEFCSLSDHFWNMKWKQYERRGKKPKRSLCKNTSAPPPSPPNACVA